MSSDQSIDAVGDFGEHLGMASQSFPVFEHSDRSIDGAGDYSEYFGMATDIEAVTYLMLQNQMLHDLFPSVITVGEDVSGMPTFCRYVSPFVPASFHSFSNYVFPTVLSVIVGEIACGMSTLCRSFPLSFLLGFFLNYVCPIAFPSIYHLLPSTSCYLLHRRPAICMMLPVQRTVCVTTQPFRSSLPFLLVSFSNELFTCPFA